MTTTTTHRSTRTATSPAERAERDTAREARLVALHAQITAGVQALAGSDGWRAMLDTASKFHRYSTGRSGVYERPEWCGSPSVGGVVRPRATGSGGRVRGGEGGESEDAGEHHRGVIEQAKGILMAVHQINETDAFAQLTQHSQNHNTKLHAVATDFVAAHSTHRRAPGLVEARSDADWRATEQPADDGMPERRFSSPGGANRGDRKRGRTAGR